jgi:transglutaminase-like putative cysteine protease
MRDAWVKLWHGVVKRPLSSFTDALYYRPLRLRATAGFNAWAAAIPPTPAAVAAAVKERVAYLSDPWRGVWDYVAAPAVTWARRAGDCDDFAYLTAELLERAGIPAWVATYVTTRPGDAHVVCLYGDDGGFGYIDQGYRRDGFATLDDAATAARPASAGKDLARLVVSYGARGDAIGRWLKRLR